MLGLPKSKFLSAWCWGFLVWACYAQANEPLPALIQSDETGQARVEFAIPGEIDALEWSSPQALAADGLWNWTQAREHVWVSIALDEAPKEARIWTFVAQTPQGPSMWPVRIDPDIKVVGPVGLGQTLWSIATGWRQQGIGAELAMEDVLTQWVAINPHAFINADPTSLRQGMVLYRPDQVLQEMPLATAPKADVITADAIAPEISEPLTAQDPSQPPVLLNPSSESEALAIDGPTDDLMNVSGEAVGLLPVDASPATQTHIIADPGKIARIAWPIFGVVLVLMVLHGWSRLRPVHRRVTLEALQWEASPMGDAQTMLDLARHSLSIGDGAQARHWLLEVVAIGRPKQVREAKRLLTLGQPDSTSPSVAHG